MWSDSSNTVMKIINGTSQNAYGIFVTENGDIFVDAGGSDDRVVKLEINTSTTVPVMYASDACFGLFVDLNNTLYCSMCSLHQVLKKSLDETLDPLTRVAGSGCPGAASNQLNSPYGIFVDVQFNLYVADCGNNRIQRFDFGQSNGTTIAGQTAPDTITLRCPSGIVLDADGYLFITDNNNNRVVASGPAGFRCIIGCRNISDSGFQQPRSPQSLSFDTDGNIFVTNWDESLVQKFILATNACSTYHYKNRRKRRLRYEL